MTDRTKNNILALTIILLVSSLIALALYRVATGGSNTTHINTAEDNTDALIIMGAHYINSQNNWR